LLQTTQAAERFLCLDAKMSGLLQNFDMFRNRKKGVTTIKGKVVLRKASLLDAKDFSASFGDRLFELMQQKVYFQLVSSDQIDKGETMNLYEILRFVLHSSISYLSCEFSYCRNETR
jgi:hypothetical protein